MPAAPGRATGGAGVLIGLGSFAGEAEIGARIGNLVAAAIYVVIGVYYRGAAGKLASAHEVMGVLVIVMVVFVLLALLIGGAAFMATG